LAAWAASPYALRTPEDHSSITMLYRKLTTLALFISAVTAAPPAAASKQSILSLEDGTVNAMTLVAQYVVKPRSQPRLIAFPAKTQRPVAPREAERVDLADFVDRLRLRQHRRSWELRLCYLSATALVNVDYMLTGDLHSDW